MKKIIKIQDLNEQSLEISVSEINNLDFISLTDMAKYKNPKRPEVEIQSWLKNKKTIQFLATWEEINNPNFKSVHLDKLKGSYRLSSKQWIEETSAKGIFAIRGKGGGTFAHRDIADNFEKWVKATPKREPDGLYIIKTGEFCKIGITQDIESRIKTIETNNPLTPKLLFYEKIENSKKVESGLHKKFKNKNIKNEWFKLTKRDISTIIKEVSKQNGIEYLSNRQKHILKLLNSDISTKEIAEKIGFSKSTVLKELNFLIEIGKIKRVRNGRKVFYSLV